MYDEDAAMYYLQSRYYDPQTGRFINADDTAFISSSGTAIGDNIYTYCENNPVNNVDYTGQWFHNLKAYKKYCDEMKNNDKMRHEYKVRMEQYDYFKRDIAIIKRN